MKKAISILLVLVIALSLCACGGNSGSGNSADDTTSKYVGTYRDTTITKIEGYYANTDYPIECILTLDANGTGSYIGRYTEDIKQYNNLTGKELLYSANKGDIVKDYDVTWEVDDGYLVVYFTGTEYTTHGKAEEDSFSLTLELKGNRLYYAGDTYARFIKS